MKKVKHILVTFLHSFIPQDIYYPKLLHTRFKLSLKYYLVVIVFFSCVFTGILLYHLSPIKITSYKNSVVNSLSAFPEGVTIKIQNGVLESNQNKPLFLWVYHDNQPLFVFMVNTKGVLTNRYIPLPLIFLGNETAQISYKGNIIVRPYKSSSNILITKESVQTLITHINTYFPPLMFFFYLLLILITPLLFVIYATLLIFLSSIFVFLLLRTFIPHIHLKKCLQAGMHCTHVPFAIVVFLFLLFPTTINILVIATALTFVFSLVGTYEMYSKEAAYDKGR
ncbi:MAG: hypothetical protein V1922_02555 [bacterium]